MTIQNKLSLLFTCLIGTILLLFSTIIYISGEKSRETAFYNSLNQEALTKANLYFNSNIDTQTLQTIYHNNRSIIHEVEVAIYDTSFNLLYHDAVDIDIVKETKKMINTIRQKHKIQFYQDKWQVIGFTYKHNNQEYIITAAAYDQNGYHNAKNLQDTLVIVFCLSIFLIYIMGRIFSKKALDPVSKLINQVQIITATNLDLRIDHPTNKDEITILAITFNEMLDRLEKSFDAQKNFVSNISHELRTPLTAMLTELQLSLQNERSKENYKQAITQAIQDGQKLVHLSNSLLDLAKANYDQTEIGFKEIRLDEILLDARNELLHKQSQYKINIIFETEIENDRYISVLGNEYLLKVAFINLMENGCKFSNTNEMTVAITHFKNKTILRFQDHGIGINEKEFSPIFTPFYRGTNKNFANGNGIGLSLTKKIITLHKGTINITSKVHEGSTFRIEIPHI